jgi:hypothetical protein
MIFEKEGGYTQACHPERSEGLLGLTGNTLGPQILRCAQDDRASIPAILVKRISDLIRSERKECT